MSEYSPGPVPKPEPDPNPEFMRELQDAFDNHTAPTMEPVDFVSYREEYFKQNPHAPRSSEDNWELNAPYGT